MLYRKGEPWLRGTHTEMLHTQRALEHALEHAAEDTERWCEGMDSEAMAAKPPGLPPVAFQLRHMARSLDRLMTYAEGGALAQKQYDALAAEQDTEVDATACLEEFRAAIKRAKERMARFKEEDLEGRCYVGRERIPTTTGGVLIHIAEHTQRHVGQLISTVKVLRAANLSPVPTAA